MNIQLICQTDQSRVADTMHPLFVHYGTNHTKLNVLGAKMGIPVSIPYLYALNGNSRLEDESQNLPIVKMYAYVGITQIMIVNYILV